MILSIANQKGGVGKTTTAVNIAHGVAKHGKRVLLIDLDTQGNVAPSLGIEQGGDLNRWLLTGEPIRNVYFPARDNLDIIRSNATTSTLKVSMSGMDFRESILSNALNRHGYDLVVMDCPPSTDLLHISALVASDFLLIPARMEQFSIQGIAAILTSLSSVQKATRTNCMLAGVLPTFMDWSTSETRLQYEELCNSGIGASLWPPIPTDTNCRAANRLGLTLHELEEPSAALIGRKGRDKKRIGGYQTSIERVLKLMR